MIALRATVPSSGDRPVDASVSGRRVARVDAGLLSSTHRGPFAYVRYHFSRRCATLSSSKPWDRARGGSFFSTPFVLHSALSPPHVRARAHIRLPTHTHEHHSRTQSTRARARTRVHTLTYTRTQAHALTHAKSDAAKRTRERTNERSFSLSLSFQPSRSGAPFFLPRSAVSSFATTTYPPPLARSLARSRPLFPPLLFFSVSLFRPSFALSLAPSLLALSLHLLGTCPTVRRFTLGATRPARRVALC